MRKIPIIKLGTVDLDIVESNPVIFKGRLYRFEYIRHRYHANILNGQSYFRFVDVQSGAIGKPFGIGLHMGNAFVWNDKVYVTCIEDWGKGRFFQMESDDMVNWSEPHVILEDPEWGGYNTSMCRADGRFLLTFELGKPEHLVKRGFTMFFAESCDLKTWKWLPDCFFDRDIYTGGPMIRYFDRWYYFFYLHEYCGDNGRIEYRQHVARSRDLKEWFWSKHNPVLDFGDDDRKVAHDRFSPEQLRKIREFENINISDLDMCQWGSDIYMVYSWGNQHGKEFLAEAKVENMTEAEFCAGLF